MFFWSHLATHPLLSLQLFAKKAGFERLGEFSALQSIGKIIALFHQWKKK